jgi:MSHA pilin protein MshC
MNFGFRIADFGCLIPHSAFRNPQSKGVTLIEVILVMVIIGIISAVVIPRMDVTLTSSASVGGAAYMVASDIRYAQEFAMANRVSRSVSFTSGSSVYTFSLPPSTLDPSGRLPTGVTISNNFTITFNSLGEPTTGGGGSVTVSAGGLLPRTISVLNYTGKVNTP